MTALTAMFADRLLSVAAADVTDSERNHAALLLADFVACASAGSARDSWYAELVDIGTSDPSAIGDAAAFAHVHDRDDVHWGNLLHCGSIIWPVVLGTGAATRATGPELLVAARVGYEAMVRLAGFLGPEHRTCFHTTATTGVVGAAAAAGFLYGLDSRSFTAALGHAISVMGGSAQTVRERSGTRLFHRAHAAQSGLAAAEAAARGLPATESGLEQVPVSGRHVGALLTEDAQALPMTSVRVFPTSGWNQAAFDAALAAGPVRRPVQQVSVDVSAAVAEISTGAEPAVEDRDWSLEWAVATALLGAESDGVAEVARRVLVRRNRNSPLQARVEVVTSGGREVGEVAFPRGHPERPADLQLVHDKWQQLIDMQPDRLHSRCRDLLISPDPGDPLTGSDPGQELG